MVTVSTQDNSFHFDCPVTSFGEVSIACTATITGVNEVTGTSSTSVNLIGVEVKACASAREWE
eukprot:1157935-Pelagomonas_calceolata.AAC.25